MSGHAVIQVELTAGRYHAHPWGVSQYGNGEPEWPPSPWRLLRAIASAAFDCTQSPNVLGTGGLLEKLGRCGRPAIFLPKAAFRELRYFQPVKKGDVVNHRADHRDCFGILEGGRFWFDFPCSLDYSERESLKKLLARIRYFGRSESRAVLTLSEQAPDISCHKPPLFEAKPYAPATDALQPSLIREVLCPGVSNGNGTVDFRADDLWKLRAGSKFGLNSQYLPEHLTDACLKARKPLPDGCEWVDYVLPQETIVAEIPKAFRPRHRSQPVRVAEIWFQLSRGIPIPIGQTVPLARAFRDGAMRNFQRLAPGQHSLALSGRQSNGLPDADNNHCYYLPRPFPTNPKRLEYLVVKLPSGGLTGYEFEALLSIARVCTWTNDPYPVTVVVEKQLEHSPRRAADRWRSITPLLVPRFLQRSRGACLNAQLPPILKRSGLSTGFQLANVRRLSVAAHDYSPGTSGKPFFARRLGYSFEIQFSQAVALSQPALGKDAHFGLGQLEPVQ